MKKTATSIAIILMATLVTMVIGTAFISITHAESTTKTEAQTQTDPRDSGNAYIEDNKFGILDTEEELHELFYYSVHTHGHAEFLDFLYEKYEDLATSSNSVEEILSLAHSYSVNTCAQVNLGHVSETEAQICRNFILQFIMENPSISYSEYQLIGMLHI